MSLIKNITGFFCALLFTACCFAQDSTGNFFKGVKTESVDINSFSPYITGTVKSIIVKDNRPDTSRLGLCKNGEKLGNYHFISGNNCQLVLDKQQTLGQLFNRWMVKDSADINVILVINHFFIANKPPLESDIADASLNQNYYQGNLTYQAKVYLQQGDKYQGLVKLDTTFNSKKTATAAFKDLVNEVLSYTSWQIGNALAENRYVKRPKLSHEEIDSLNQPLYAESFRAVRDSGYYLTFDDFLSQKLTQANFETEKLQDECFYVYTVEKDNTRVLTRDIWGLVMGGQTYIMNEGLLFPLKTIKNGYYWKGPLRFKEGGTILPLAAPVGGGTFVAGYTRINTKLKIEYAPFLLNMQTGARY